MALSNQQMTRLGELLDESLPLPPIARRAWLESLPDEDRPLVRTLREALLADDPATVSSGPLDRPPRIRELNAANEPTTARQAGERLGAYELLQPLGAGGMAEVWLARRADGAFERQVALKIPRLRDMPAEMVERFARECSILATLECPGIARLYDAGVDGSGVPYIAMEYVQGEPLTAWCDARGLDVPSRINEFLQVLDAVGYAHARNVIHRDIKPSNILVTDKGEVRLLDFGVARLLQVETHLPSITRIHGRALTPEYASPELLRSEPIDQRSDIYSLGVVLHELLTGARPGQPLPSTGAGELQGVWRDVVNKALATAPADRYADAASFAAALRQAVTTSAAPVRRHWRNPRYVAAVLVAIALAVGAAYLFEQSRSSVPSLAATTTPSAPVAANASTIAVLPFVDLSEKQDQGFFSDGLSEELIALLTKVPDLRVTARASSFAFRDRRNDIPAIARQLNVENILDGSVRKSGNHLRFAVQLVQASTGTVVWSETYDRETKDVFELQEDVAGAVVDALKLRLLAGQHIPAGERTANAQAYEQYLQGLKFREGASVDDKRRAIAAFQQAVALDPKFATGYAAIANTAVGVGGLTVDSAMYELARSNAERAIALSPRLTAAYIARADVRMHNDWDFAGAKADLDTALGIDPNSIGVQNLKSTYLLAIGKPAEALTVQLGVVERNPLHAGAWSMLHETYMGVRDYPNARTALDRAAQLSKSDKSNLQSFRSSLELYAGNFQEALRQARQIKDPHFRDFAIAMAAWSTGSAGEARAALQRLIAEVPNVFAAQIAEAAAWQGDRELTYRWLDHALDLHDAGLIAIKERPEFDKFKGDPRFEAALRRMNLPQ
jgi:serine/threonine protein kinase/tetratricopeptide (TPR) repeat protein